MLMWCGVTQTLLSFDLNREKLTIRTDTVCQLLAYFKLHRALACVLLAANEDVWCTAEGAVEALCR